MYWKTLFSLILLSSSLSALSLTFIELKEFHSHQQNLQDLKKKLTPYHEKKLSIRGFLHQTADQTWILAAEPLLKSCCIGGKHKVFHQVYLENFPTPSLTRTPVELHGSFSVKPTFDPQGKLHRLYFLSFQSRKQAANL